MERRGRDGGREGGREGGEGGREGGKGGSRVPSYSGRRCLATTTTSISAPAVATGYSTHSNLRGDMLFNGAKFNQLMVFDA